MMSHRHEKVKIIPVFCPFCNEVVGYTTINEEQKEQNEIILCPYCGKKILQK